MNTDQALSLTRSILKIAGAALAAHGATQAAGWINSEDVIGVALTVVGLVMSNYTHKEDLTAVPKPQPQPENKTTP